MGTGYQSERGGRQAKVVLALLDGASQAAAPQKNGWEPVGKAFSVTFKSAGHGG